jgi:LysM repeat protein
MRIVTRTRAWAASLGAAALVSGMALAVSTAHARPAEQGTTMVAITPAQSQVTCGEQVPVEIRINNVTGLYGVDVRVTYDPSVVEVADANPTAPGIQIQPGNFPDVANGQGLVQVNNVDPAQGTISYAAIRLNPADPQTGSGVIATITFRGKANGPSPVNLAWVMLSDRNARPIAAELANGSITSSGCDDNRPTSTRKPPTPATPGTPGTPGYPTATTPPGYPTPIPGKECYHVVKPGETLSGIAKMYGTTVQALMQANGLYNPNLIYAGQKLYIPGCGSGGYGTPVPPPPSGGTGGCFTYIVKPGDTLSSIAYRTGDTVLGIAKRNGLVNPNLIYAGQPLVICPGGGSGGSGGYPPVPPKPGCRAYYLVKPGDTLYRIAMYYGTTVYAIASANGLANPNWIYAGQTLCIP